MSIQDLASIGEPVAALATVATLVYLAFRILQNTRALRGAAHEKASARVYQHGLTAASNPEFAEVLRLGCDDPDRLTPVEIHRHQQMSASIFGGIEPTYWQHRRALDEIDSS